MNNKPVLVRLYRPVLTKNMSMKPRHFRFWPVYLALLGLFACTDQDEGSIDEERPVLTLDYLEGFPRSCAALTKGQTYQFRIRAEDNLALASYSLDIHHNFDHHTHDDQGEKCALFQVKQPMNPMIFIENFSIENGPASYEIVIPVEIPDDVDTGDYHCQFSVTDITGWQARLAVDIKIVD